MNDILALGTFLLVGFTFGNLFKKMKLPAVTGYLIAGLIIGVSFLNIFPEEIMNELAFMEDVALGFIAFHIGESFNYGKVKSLGGKVVIITLIQAAITILFVTFGVYFVTKDLPLAIVFGAISAATAPAATLNVMKEYKAKGPLTNMILTVVALDDAVCLFLFSICLAVAQSLIVGTFSLATALIAPLIEIFGSLALGFLIGTIFALLGKTRRHDEDLLTLSCTSVLVGAGLGYLLHLSPILICMAIGAALANLCKRHDDVFILTEEAVSPIYLIFFVMAGYNLDLKMVLSLGVLGLVFVVSRTIGKLLGAYVGCEAVKTDKITRNYLGMGLMPMAGVGVGLAVAAARVMPEYSAIFLNIIMGSTFIFEIFGPIFTAKGLKKAGEIKV